MRRIGNGSSRCFPVFLLPLMLAGLLLGQQKPKTPQCKSAILAFSLKAGEGFQQEIGDLAFALRPDAALGKVNGWTVLMIGEGGNEFIAPVSIPLRFNPSQILGPGYGYSAKDSLQMQRELPFLLSHSDYELVNPLWQDALWPYNAPDPDRAGDKYVSAIAKLTLGMLKLKVLNADISPDDVIRSASFEVSFVVPSGFHLDPSLKPRPVACPHPFK
jgi:hypothetical protein